MPKSKKATTLHELLGQTLEEEELTDEKLSALAETKVNAKVKTGMDKN